MPVTGHDSKVVPTFHIIHEAILDMTRIIDEEFHGKLSKSILVITGQVAPANCLDFF